MRRSAVNGTTSDSVGPAAKQLLQLPNRLQGHFLKAACSAIAHQQWDPIQ